MMISLIVWGFFFGSIIFKGFKFLMTTFKQTYSFVNLLREKKSESNTTKPINIC